MAVALTTASALIAVGWVGATAVPASAAGFTVRVSSALAGGEGNGFSNGSTLSDDGRSVAFASDADNLVAGDVNLVADVFVRDRFAGSTTLVSVDATGGPADGISAEAWISGNGRYVAFMSEATDLVAGDTNSAPDVFVRDLLLGTTERASLSDTDAQLIDGVSYEPSISDDGRYVEFSSDASTVVADDFNDSEDVFLRDRLLATTVRASVTTAGVEADFGAYEGVISGNGRHVAFTSDHPFVTTDVNDEDDVYRHNLDTGATNRVSSAASGLGGGYSAAVSDDGGFIAFVSDYQLAGPGADANFLPDIYVRNTTAGSTARASLTSGGTTPTDLSIGPSISDDGRFVAYYTLATGLGAVDTNATFDVWLRDRTLGTNTRVSVDGAGGDPNDASEVPFVAGSGGFVSFQSPATDLVAPDGTSVDIYVRSLTDDVTAPTVSIAAPVAGTYEIGASVIADYVCTDDVGGSGIASCAGTVADGDPIDTATLGAKSFTVVAADTVGNPRTVTVNYTVVDSVAPVIAVTTPVDGAMIDQYATVFADYACTDPAPASGIASCAGTVADGAALDTATLGAHAIVIDAADVAGNLASTTVNYTVVDVAGPDITIAAPVDGATYDRGAVVLADYACVDGLGGSGVASCAGPVADGAAIDTTTLGAHSFVVTSTDNASNTTSLTVEYTVADVTGPAIAITTPANAGSYPRHATVLADFACADEPGGSGLATCIGSTPDGDAIDTATIGPRLFTVDASDLAGNPATLTVGYAVVDATAPTVVILAPVDGAEFARGAVVAADYSCADELGGSGVASCVGTVADGATIDTATLGSHAFEVVAIDVAGNTATVSATYTVTDVIAPTVSITTPADGASYQIGQLVDADYACADEVDGSGIASCVGTVADGAAIDTATLGAKTFAVTATDQAGNPTTLTVGYTVVSGIVVSIGDATVVETDTGAQVVKLSVSLTDVAAVPMSVRYTATAGSATPATATVAGDFVAKSAVLTFKPGQVFKTVSIALRSDVTIEGDETFTVDLSTPVGVAIGDGSGLVTLLEDDDSGEPSLLRVAAGDATVHEGSAPKTRKVSFVVSLENPSTGGIAVQYSVTGTSATGGTNTTPPNDFKIRSGTLVFNAGQRFKVVAVVVYGDTVPEPDETLLLTLANPVGTTILRAVGTGTIVDDD